MDSNGSNQDYIDQSIDSSTGKKKWIVVAIVVCAGILLFLLIGKCGSRGNGVASDSTCVKAAQELLIKHYSRGTLHFTGYTTILRDSYGRVIVGIKNWLETDLGSTSERVEYICFQSITSDGRYTYGGYYFSTGLDSLQWMNNWNQPR